MFLVTGDAGTYYPEMESDQDTSPETEPEPFQILPVLHPYQWHLIYKMGSNLTILCVEEKKNFYRKEHFFESLVRKI